MRTIFCFIFTLLFSLNSLGQSASSFEVSEGVLTDSLRLILEALKKENRVFYEDADYLISKTCSGEWGGTALFKNKTTGVEYVCSATCPISVNKIYGKYYLTNSLGHLSGSCEVLEISQPTSMEVLRPSPSDKKKRKKIHYVGDDESKSNMGTKKLAGNYGMLILASFVFKNDLFHIVAENRKTYLAVIENGEFLNVKSITNEDTFTYDNQIIKTADGHLMIPIFKGYLDILDNRILILRQSVKDN